MFYGMHAITNNLLNQLSYFLAKSKSHVLEIEMTFLSSFGLLFCCWYMEECCNQMQTAV